MKNQELTGFILSKEARKVYKKEFYGNINYKLSVLNSENQQKLTLFVYSNLIKSEILQVIEQNQFINQKYYFFFHRKGKVLVLNNLQKIETSNHA
jgi:hypothetical protein